MAERHRAGTLTLRERGRLLSAAAQEKSPVVEAVADEKQGRGDTFLRNLAVAAALVLCAVMLRTGAIPPVSDAADAVLTAATDRSLLDDQLGKLSFVSALFPEAVLVFGEQTQSLAQPVSGGTVVHAWSEAEPYTSWRTGSRQVCAAASGEVIGVYHANGAERLVQVLGEDGLACLYGNLEEVAVQTGDRVLTGDTLGTLLQGEDCVFEVRRDGISVDPARYLGR